MAQAHLHPLLHAHSCACTCTCRCLLTHAQLHTHTSHTSTHMSVCTRPCVHSPYTRISTCQGLQGPTHVSAGVCVYSCTYTPVYTHSMHSCTPGTHEHTHKHTAAGSTQSPRYISTKEHTTVHISMHSYTSGMHRHLYTHICTHKHIRMLTFACGATSADQQHMTKHRGQKAIHGAADTHQHMCAHTDTSAHTCAHTQEHVNTRVHTLRHQDMYVRTERHARTHVHVYTDIRMCMYAHRHTSARLCGC